MKETTNTTTAANIARENDRHTGPVEVLTSHADALTLKAARRAFDNHKRHAVTLPDCIALPRFTASFGFVVLDHAARDARTVTRARYESSFAPIMQQLNRDICHAERATRAAEVISRAGDKRSEAATLRDRADRLQRVADRKSTPAAQAAPLTLEAEALRTVAAELVTEAREAEEKSYAMLEFGDGADIMQDAALRRLMDTAEAGRMDLRSARSAAGKGISAIKAAAGIPSTRTKVESFAALAAADLKRAGQLATDAGSKANPYTDKQREAISAHADSMRAALIKRYAGAEKMPFSVREAMTAGYYSIEYRNSDQYPAAWYLVTHYSTFAPARLDDYATGAAEDSDSRATLADTVREMHAHMIPGAEDDPCEIIEAAKLTERERSILVRAADQSDPIIAAVDLRAAERYQKQTDERAATLDQRAAKKYRAGRARRETTYRSRAALRAAMQLEGIDPNKGRYILTRMKRKLEAAAADLKAARLNRSGAPRITDAPRLIWWYELQGAPTADPAPVIRWTRRPYAQDVQTISTPADIEREIKARRAAEIAAHEAAQAAKAAHAAAADRAAEYFVKPARSSAALFEAAFAANRWEKFEAKFDRIEAVQQRRNVEAAAEEARQRAEADERRARYNAALRAALDQMGITWRAATQEQREKATSAARAAID